MIPGPQQMGQYVIFSHPDMYMMRLHFTKEKYRNSTCGLQKETRFPNMKGMVQGLFMKNGVFSHGQPVSSIFPHLLNRNFHTFGKYWKVKIPLFLLLHSFCCLIGKIETHAHLGVSLLDRSNNFLHLFSIW